MKDKKSHITKNSTRILILLTKFQLTGRQLYCKDRTGYEFYCCGHLLTKTPLKSWCFEICHWTERHWSSITTHYIMDELRRQQWLQLKLKLNVHSFVVSQVRCAQSTIPSILTYHLIFCFILDHKEKVTWIKLYKDSLTQTSVVEPVCIPLSGSKSVPVCLQEISTRKLLCNFWTTWQQTSDAVCGSERGGQEGCHFLLDIKTTVWTW